MNTIYTNITTTTTHTPCAVQNPCHPCNLWSKKQSWLKVFVFVFVFVLTSCTSEDTLEDEHQLDLREPMVFGSSSAASSASVETRAPIENTNTNFKVNTWKSFGTASQAIVMNGYEVDYTSTPLTDAPDTYNWYYEGINSQILRYWDLGAFPNEFRAVSPYLNGASITEGGITINLATDSKAFQAQSLVNDVYNVSDAEPCVVAHVSRVKSDADYNDRDLIKNEVINDAGKANATREVHLPFHHLNCKVGFRIFIDKPQPEYDGCNANIKSITITAQNTDGFITASTTYTATNAQGLGNGTFSDNTTTTVKFTLLQHGEYKENNQDMNLCHHQSHDDAYDLCPNCMQQIPQGKVKIKVEVQIDVDGLDQNYTRWLSTDDDKTDGDPFTWEPDTRYIYYLHIKDLRGGKIFLETCEILPWDEVQTTDIEVGL